MVSYINYELLIEWPWQWAVVRSLMTSQWTAGFPGDNNTPSPRVTGRVVRELARGIVGDWAGPCSKTLEIITRRIGRRVQVRRADSLMV
jgi:hypothetical protein